MAAGKGDKEDSQLLETGPLLPPDSPSSVGPWWESGRSCFLNFHGGQGCQKSEDLFSALSLGKAKTISFLIPPGPG